MTAPLSSRVFEEHQHCSRRRGKGIWKAILACCSWTLWQHVGGCAVQSLMGVLVCTLHCLNYCMSLRNIKISQKHEDLMVWPLHWHHHCISLRSIDVAHISVDEVPDQLPTWLWLCLWLHIPWGLIVQYLLTVMTPFLFSVFEMHQNFLTRTGKGIWKAILACCGWTLWQHVCRCAVQIFDGCDGMHIALPSSLYVIEEHQDLSKK